MDCTPVALETPKGDDTSKDKEAFRCSCCSSGGGVLMRVENIPVPGSFFLGEGEQDNATSALLQAVSLSADGETQLSTVST